MSQHFPPLSVLIALLPCLAAASPAHAAAEVYRFDRQHSQILFAVAHQNFSNALGRLRIKDGWFSFDENDWRASRVDVVIDMTSLDLGDARWNEAARASSLLDTARWPTARFVSRSVERHADNQGVLHGELSLHGVTRPLDIAFHLNRVATDPYLFKRKAGFSATAALLRQDFGMTRFADVVGAKIELRIEIEGIRDAHAGKTEVDDGVQK